MITLFVSYFIIYNFPDRVRDLTYKLFIINFTLEMGIDGYLENRSDN